VPNVYDSKHKCIEKFKKSEGFSVTVDETQDKKCRAVLYIIVTPSATASPLNDQYLLRSTLIDTIFLNCSVDSSTIVVIM
jgi:hypothetical protein